MAEDTQGLGIPLPADSTPIHQYPKIAREMGEAIAKILAGGIMTPGLAALAGEAVTKQLTAQIANADLITGSDKRLPFNSNAPVPGTESLLAAITDAAGRLSWLSARASDGGPTDWALQMLTDRLGYDVADGNHNILFSVLDAADRMTDLTVRSSDGQFPDFVIDRLRRRLGTITGDVGGAAQFAPGDRYTRGAEVLPVMADMRKMAGWGSSSMEGIGSALGAVMFPGVTLLRGGKSGETASQIAARIGSVPALVTVPGGTLPAAREAVPVTVPNLTASASLKAYEGTLAGVPGTLAYSAAVSSFTFTRTTAGAAVQIPAGSPLISTLGAGNRDAVTLLWMGKNDLFGSAGADARVIALTDASYDWLSPLIRRTLVIGHFVNGKTPAVSAARDQILAVNAAHKQRYGDLYLDVQDYLTGSQIWKDTGITPTAADLAEQAIGNKPASISNDDGHLNAAGYAAVAKRITAKLTALGWY